MTTWRFGAYDLASFGKLTLLDDSMSMAERRGRNQIIPFRHGSRFVEKYYDERTMQFGMLIEAGTAAALEATMETLTTLFAVRTPQPLTKILANGSEWSAQATVDKRPQFKYLAPDVARLTFEFTLPGVFFRTSSPIADNTTVIDANPKAMVVTNPGTVEERDPTTILTGPLQNTVITNQANGCILTYTGTIAAPRVVTIETVNGQFVATDDLGADKIGSISHQGASALMVIDSGVNNLSIADDTHTTGAVKITFNPPRL